MVGAVGEIAMPARIFEFNFARYRFQKAIRQFAIAVFLSSSIATLSEASSTTLSIHGTVIPPNLIDAYKTHFKNRYGCPAVADSIIRSRLVEAFLLAAEQERQVFEPYEANIELHERRRDRLENWLAGSIKNDHIRSVYQRQRTNAIEMIKKLTAEFTQDMLRRHKRHIEFNLFDGATELRAKHSMQAIASLQRSYERVIFDQITEEMVKQRYDQLIEDRDPRLVDVTLVREKFVPLLQFGPKETSRLTPDRLENVIAMIKKGDKFEDILMYSNMRITASTLMEPHWVLFDMAHLNSRAADNINTGEIIGPFMYGQFEHLTHVVDQRYYAQIYLDQKIELPKSDYARSLVKDDLLAFMLNAGYLALRAEADILENNLPVNDYPDYKVVLGQYGARQPCPRSGDD